MSQQLTQNAFVDNLGEKYQWLLDSAKRFPISAWRAIVIVVAAIWLVRSAASLFWLIFPIPQVSEPNKLALPMQVQSAAPTKSVSFDTVSPLASAFGPLSSEVVIVDPQPAPVDPGTDAPETKLRLKLHGVFASSDPALGSAIIADGNKQVLYGVNDDIEGNRGVRLAAVLEQRVILDNNGRRESLWLFSEDDKKSLGVASSRRPAQRSRPAVAPRPVTANSGRAAAIRRDQIPKNIGDVVRFSVHREGGKMVGYRVRPGRDRELFNQVGLKANDIVTTVNGIEVNDPKQIRSVYKSMKTATEAQLTVLREGQTHSITISLDSDA